MIKPYLILLFIIVIGVEIIDCKHPNAILPDELSDVWGDNIPAQRVARSARPSVKYEVGVGKADITGPIDLIMQGYAQEHQVAEGIEGRLLSRAFIIKHNQHYMAYCAIELWGLSRAIQHAVLKKLEKLYPGRYNEHNLVLTASHTHAGPGGYQGWFLYDFSGKGFHHRHFRKVVSGIVSSIKRATASIQLGHVYQQRYVADVGDKQRSNEAYEKNADAKAYKHNVNPIHNLLLFKDVKQTLLGAIAFHGLHPTSYSNLNRMVSGDNRGVCMWLVEHLPIKNTKKNQFVFALVQTSLGDISPNTIVDASTQTFRSHHELLNKLFTKDPKRYAKRIHQLEREGMFKSVRRQARVYERILNDASDNKNIRELRGVMTCGTVFKDFSNIVIENDKNIHTCKQAVGMNFLAGTEDGRGLKGIKEGIKNKHVLQVLGHITAKPSQIECQKPKEIFLNIASEKHSLTPRVLPLQSIRIGDFVILHLPFELTTMAYRRLYRSIISKHENIHMGEIVSVANAYAGYLTTPEEYDAQHYEGASTLFGRTQLRATIQEMSLLTKKVMQNRIDRHKVTSKNIVHDMDPKKFIDLQIGVMWDSTPIGRAYGDVVKQPSPKKTLRCPKSFMSSSIAFEFVGSHPKNGVDLKSFCDLEIKNGNTWKRVMRDDHPFLSYKWKRKGLSESRHICRVYLAKEMQGQFRVVARGVAKNKLQNRQRWQGMSLPFTVMCNKNLRATYTTHVADTKTTFDLQDDTADKDGVRILDVNTEQGYL